MSLPDVTWALGRPTIGLAATLASRLRVYGRERVPHVGYAADPHGHRCIGGRAVGGNIGALLDTTVKKGRLQRRRQELGKQLPAQIGRNDAAIDKRRHLLPIGIPQLVIRREFPGVSRFRPYLLAG